MRGGSGFTAAIGQGRVVSSNRASGRTGGCLKIRKYPTNGLVADVPSPKFPIPKSQLAARRISD